MAQVPLPAPTMGKLTLEMSSTNLAAYLGQGLWGQMIGTIIGVL